MEPSLGSARRSWRSEGEERRGAVIWGVLGPAAVHPFQIFALETMDQKGAKASIQEVWGQSIPWS